MSENVLSYDLRVGPLSEAEVSVREVRGFEELSAPFSFEVDFIPVSGEPVDVAGLPGTEACLTLQGRTGEERWVHGICARADHTGVQGNKPSYRITIAPKVALLGLKRNCRVFQEMTAVEIVKSILDEGEVTHQEKLRASYPKREMCIQYRETDLAFVSRLLEEEGIAFWFEQSEDGEVMVLGDAPDAFSSLPGGEELPVRPDTGATPDEEHLSMVRVERGIRPGKAVLRGFDFQNPTLDVTGTTGDETGAEVYDCPARAFAASDVSRLARIELEELQVNGQTWRCRSTSIRLAPGHVFEVSEHPDPSLDERLVVARINHQGRQQTSAGDVEQIAGGYVNSFTALGRSLPYRPPRRHARPVIAGPQTATVVGPGGEEIYPDRYGRVKVQFHWDRKGKRDERSSAWVRLMRSWSGAGFGALYVPRIGQEVLVRFHEGNPDRPMVAGAIYNGLNPSPVVLPRDKTQSTLKTDSSPHDGGYNELLFEDQAGAEEIHLHGEKDEVIAVENDKTQEVRANEALTVGKDRTQTVKGMQELAVGLDDSSAVDGNRTLTVQMDRWTDTTGDHLEEVRKNDTVVVASHRGSSVTGLSEHVVGAAAKLATGMDYDLTVGADFNETVTGKKVARVTADKRERIGEADASYAEGENTASRREEHVTGSAKLSIGEEDVRDVSGHAAGDAEKDWEEDASAIEIDVPKEHAVWEGKSFTLEADKLSIVVGGKVAVSMDKSGMVKIAGQEIRMANFSGAGNPMNITGPGAASGMGGALKQAKKLELAMAVAEFTLIDQDGSPVVNQKFRIKFSDGSVRKGTTDGEGHVRVPAPRKGTFELTLLPDRKARGT